MCFLLLSKYSLNYYFIVFVHLSDRHENEDDEGKHTTIAVFVIGREDSLHPPKYVKIVTDGTFGVKCFSFFCL